MLGMGRTLLLVASLLYATHESVVVASAQAVAGAGGEERSSVEEFGIDLYALSDNELEDICTIRGFELVQEVDDATGEQHQFTHEDYVEAAMQCLAIERDMEAIIEEHPEILDELEAERDRMMEEKDRLEKELAEADKRESSKEGKTEAAFLPKTKMDTTTSGEASAPVKKPKSVTSDKKTARTTVEDVESNVQPEQQTSQLIGESGTTPSPFSMPELVRSTISEFRERVQNDLKKVIERVLPESIRGPLSDALRPILRVVKQMTKDSVKFLLRYGRALIKQVSKKVAEKAKDINERRSGGEPPATNAQSSS